MSRVSRAPFFLLPFSFPCPELQPPVDAKKSAPLFSGALLCHAANSLFDHDKLRIACADHPLHIYEAVHEHEVRVPDQPEMARPESLDEELFRMPSKTEHFGVTRPELLLVHRRRLTRAAHVRLARPRACARARTCARFIPVHVLSAALNVRLSTHICARLRFCLWFARLRLRRAHLLRFRRRSSLRVLCLLLRLLRLRCLA